MRRLQATRRGEVKALAKKHRDRDELVRVKREFASALVERGVAERVRVAQSYEAKRDDLVRQHELVRLALAEHKTKVTNSSRVFVSSVAYERCWLIAGQSGDDEGVRDENSESGIGERAGITARLLRRILSDLGPTTAPSPWRKLYDIINN